MDSFELNKIAGAVLGAGLLLMVINEVGNALVHPTAPESNVIGIEVAGNAAAPAAAKADEPAVPIATLLASADAGKGEKVFGKCKACHTFEKDGANKVGPALYGVLGRDIASVDGFSYSGALAELGGNWGFDEMNAFLENPKGFAKGTKMAFAGLKKDSDRANLILWLRDQADSPMALPAQ